VVTIPVVPGWLPPEIRADATVIGADLGTGTREATYSGVEPGRPGVETVAITTTTGRPAPATGHPDVPASPPDRGSTEDSRRVQVRGHTATQSVVINESGWRTCSLSWRERSGLWITVWVSETLADMSISCDIGRTVARELRTDPVPVVSPRRLGLVPRGYTLSYTGTRSQAWCPTSGDVGDLTRCLRVRRAEDEAVDESWTKVTVGGRIGWLDRSEDGVEVLVPGVASVSTITAQVDPAVADLTDAELIRIAASVQVTT
jgi:hypothetical protein